MSLPERLDPNFWGQQDTQDREVRAEEANIRQSGASAASSEARTATEEATRPYNVRKAAADAGIAQINLREAERNAQRAAQNDLFRVAREQSQFSGVFSAIDQARAALRNPLASGIPAQLTGNLYGTPIRNLRALYQRIRSPIVTEAMNNMRAGSAAGATGFGQLTIKEMELLASSIAALDDTTSPELQLDALDQIEQHFRRALAFSMGFDPRTEAGATAAGLPYDPQNDPIRNPAAVAAADARAFNDMRAYAELNGGSTPSGLDISGIVDQFAPVEYTDIPVRQDPGADRARGELLSGAPPPPPPSYGLEGVDDAVRGIIRSGVSQKLDAATIEEQVRSYLNGVQPGLADRTTGLSSNISYAIETGRDPRVRVADTAAEAAGGERPGFGTAYATGMADALTFGSFDELTGKGAEMAALEEENPGGYMTGQVAGGLLTSLLGGAGVARTGLNVPWYLQGIGTNAAYGAGSAEEGDRLAGATVGAMTTPFANAAGQVFMRPFTTALRGTMDEGARTLAQRYNIDLTPGSVNPGGVMSRLESTVSGLPFGRGMVQDRADESLLSFNRAMFDTAEAPLAGVSARENALVRIPPRPTETIGREGLVEGNQRVRDALNQSVQGVELSVDPARVFDDSFLNGVEGAAAANARNALANARNNLVQPGGVLRGEDIRRAREVIYDVQDVLNNSPDVPRTVADAARGLRTRLLNEFEQQAPDRFSSFRAADEAYGNMRVVERAVAGGRENADIVPLIDQQRGRTVTPVSLNNAARANERNYIGQQASAEGQGTFAELADYGERLVQPSRSPSLGDTLRSGAAVGLPLAGYVGASSVANSGEGEEGSASDEPPVLPAAGIGAVSLGALLSLPFTRGGSRLYQQLMTSSRPQIARTIGDLATRYGIGGVSSAFARPYIQDDVADPTRPEAIEYQADLQALMNPMQPATPLSSLTERYADQPSTRAAPYRTNAGINIPPAAAPADPQAAPSTAQTGVVNINGRPARYDEATDRFLDVETGEPVDEGYKHGGRVKRRPVPTRALKG